jgi:hypothetical protein
MAMYLFALSVVVKMEGFEARGGLADCIRVFSNIGANKNEADDLGK